MQSVAHGSKETTRRRPCTLISPYEKHSPGLLAQQIHTIPSSCKDPRMRLHWRYRCACSSPPVFRIEFLAPSRLSHSKERSAWSAARVDQPQTRSSAILVETFKISNQPLKMRDGESISAHMHIPAQLRADAKPLCSAVHDRGCCTSGLRLTAFIHWMDISTTQPDFIHPNDWRGC